MTDRSGYVGIVVPAYRCEAFLPATLDSICSQRFNNWRAVVVDDGSPDDVASIASAYARHDSRISVVRQGNAGVSVARNRGADEMSDASFLLFCDADDVLLPNAVLELVTTLQSAPGVAAAHGLATMVDTQGERIGTGWLTEFQRHHYDVDGQKHLNVGPLGLIQLARENWLSIGGVLVDAFAFRRLGGFDPALSYAADWDMWLRLSRVGGIVTLHGEVLLYRQHADSMTVTGRRELHRELRRVRAKTYRAPENSRADRKMLRRINRQHHLAHVRTPRRTERGGILPDAAARAAHLALAAWGRPVRF